MTSYKDNDNTMDDLLVKYLLRETTASEDTEAKRWITASADHKRYFDDFKQIWQSSRYQTMADSPMEDEAWQRFQQQVQQRKNQSQHTAVFSTKRLISAAAILLIIIAGSWILYRQIRPSSGQLFTLSAGKSICTDTLSDGTIITLNKNSKLSYPLQFSGKSRTVQLQGEAFFDVAQQKGHPFVVRINNITVTVLGTSFNINGTGNTTEVIVETGKVKITARKNSIQLSAHEKVTVSGKKGPLKKQRVSNELYNYYRTKEFICNKTPLRELVPALNEVYGVHIIIANPELENLPLTTIFHHDQPLDSILTIIAQTFNQVTFTRQGQQIILK